MGDTIKNYEFGLGGVNKVVDPLKMALNEATQLQNAEVRQDADAAWGGGEADTDDSWVAATVVLRPA